MQATKALFKLLGILFDEFLSFDQHSTHLCGKIRKIKNLLQQNALKTLFGWTSQQNIKRIFIKQKEAIRVIANANYREHTPPLFKNLKILPLGKIIPLSKLKFMHSYVFDRLPLSFAET
jgi:hypothetical protein